jgi:chromate reductase
LPAALKNALDIASRPYGSNKFDGKPAAIISVSPGAMGGFGANHHLRQVFTFLNVYPVQQPEVYIGSVHTLMDEKGNVAESTKELLKSVISALVKKL